MDTTHVDSLCLSLSVCKNEKGRAEDEEGQDEVDKGHCRGQATEAINRLWNKPFFFWKRPSLDQWTVIFKHSPFTVWHEDLPKKTRFSLCHWSISCSDYSLWPVDCRFDPDWEWPCLKGALTLRCGKSWILHSTKGAFEAATRLLSRFSKSS